MEPSIDNQYIKTPKLDTIYLYVTSRCSLNCAYCYLDADISSDDIITSEQSQKVFADAVLLNCRRIVFTGGEPLMHPELFRMAEELSRVDKEHKILRCISTNGMYIDEGNAKKIVDLFDDKGQYRWNGRYK